MLFRLKYIKISFSIQREAYVASLIFFPVLNVFIAFINPIVPIEIKSSKSIPVFSNFLAIYTTNLKFLSTKICFELLSSSSILESTSISSSAESGGGKVWLPLI